MLAKELLHTDNDLKSVNCPGFSFGYTEYK